MKKFKMIILTLLMLFPTLVIAETSYSIGGIPLMMTLFVEAFVTIHMTVFVLLPFSKMVFPKNSKKAFWILFIGRIVVLLLFDFFVTTSIMIIDFLAVFVGAFIVIPITAVITKSTRANSQNTKINQNKQVNMNNNFTYGMNINCTKCGGALKITDKFCTNCGTPFDGNNVTISAVGGITPLNSNANEAVAAAPIKQKVMVSSSSFDPMYNLEDDELLEKFIEKELIKAGVDKNINLIPRDAVKRKKIMDLIFLFLIFIFVLLIFFHFPMVTYIIGLIMLFIFRLTTNRYNFMTYLKKQAKARPSEKISNIVMTAKASMVLDDRKFQFIFCCLVAIILPMIMFLNPKILYEKVDGGYAVRYYIFGLTNFTSVTIPETYKNENVVSLRGNAFSNMPFLKEVSLPDTITEIRGQAFKNDRNLVKVNIPKNLTYLGGGSFYNCTSLTEISLPDTITELGGEVFYNATSLKSVKLPNGITEIRGSSFENCSSLKSVKIPDSVTRIGGHAFRECTSLKEVQFTENSQLREIGSSAFRNCKSLNYIILPKGVSINERSFKGSFTTIKEFGEIEYGNLASKDNYKYNTSIYVHIGESEEINKYKEQAQVQNAYIYLEKVNVTNGKSEFILRYKDANIDETFTLSAGTPFKGITHFDGYSFYAVAIEVSSEYVFDYDNRVSLKVYYN